MNGKGVYLVGLPEDTLKVLKALSSKLGVSHAEVLAEGLAVLARKHLVADLEKAAKGR